MANKTIDKRKPRKIVSIVWLAQYIGIHRHTVARYVVNEKVDLWDLRSVFGFILKHSEYIKHRRGLPHYFFGKYHDPVAFRKEHGL